MADKKTGESAEKNVMHKIFIQILCVRSVKVLRFNFFFFYTEM